MEDSGPPSLTGGDVLAFVNLLMLTMPLYLFQLSMRPDQTVTTLLVLRLLRLIRWRPVSRRYSGVRCLVVSPQCKTILGGPILASIVTTARSRIAQICSRLEACISQELYIQPSDALLFDAPLTDLFCNRFLIHPYLGLSA
jgi:ABC-type protease/lipase transport system fused ATPase/permease subunit